MTTEVVAMIIAAFALVFQLIVMIGTAVWMVSKVNTMCSHLETAMNRLDDKVDDHAERIAHLESACERRRLEN